MFFFFFRYVLLPTLGVLQLVGVLPADAGRYRCTVSNPAGSKSSKEFQLQVQEEGEAYF